jgi:hypothetical protein
MEDALPWQDQETLHTCCAGKPCSRPRTFSTQPVMRIFILPCSYLYDYIGAWLIPSMKKNIRETKVYFEAK